MKILFLTLLLVVIIYLYLILPRIHKPDGGPLVRQFYAHRGLHDIENEIPENSMTAFRRAVERGYGIELDVQLTSDGIPVVFHDATLSRMCAIDRRVDSFTYDELRCFRLAGTNEEIPSFKDVLALVDGRTPLLIEIKMDKIDLAIPRTVDSLLSGYQGAYCVESFHPIALWWYRKYRPDVLRGQLATNFNIENRSISPLQYLLGKMVLNIISRPDFISYNWRFKRDLSRRICCRIFRAHSAGWVIRSEKELLSCKRSFSMFIFEDFYPRLPWKPE